MSMDEIRDPEIGGLLAGGSVAEHEPGYWDALRAAVAPELAALEPQTVRRERPRRRRLLRMGLAAAAVAAAAVFAFAVLPALHGTDTATAADMLASMNAASSDVQTVRLHIVQGSCGSPDSPPPASPQPTTIAGQVALIKRKTITDLILSTNGDFRASEGTERLPDPHSSNGEKPIHMGQYGYDASRHELRVHSGTQVWMPAWPTGYPNNDVDYLNYQKVANSVRAILAEADPEMPVTETTYLGRPAWATGLRSHDFPDYERRVTVDQATGLLLASDEILERPTGDGLVTSLRVTRLEVDPDLPKDWQLVPFPEKKRGVPPWVSYMDEGVRFGSPQSVAKRSGSTPALFPQWVPPGYRRSAAATAVFDDPRPGHEYDNSWHWGYERIEPHGSTPAMSFTKRLALKRCQQKVLVEYRRGFDSFSIRVHRRLPGEGMVDQRSADVPRGRDTILTGGYLKGATARTWLSAGDYSYRGWDGGSWVEATQGPTLLAYQGRWKVVISGGLTRQELVEVANSLQQVHGD
jgi:hypothetical protein